MRIIIGADIVPTESNKSAFINADVKSLIDEKLIGVLKNADYRVFNLEVPLTDRENPIEKCGPNLIAPKASMNGIRAVGADFVTLANNHIMDQGETGLCDTLDALNQVGITYAGVGKTIEEAAASHIITIDNIKIGFYCCAEHEFSIVSDTSAGANPFDPLWSFDHIHMLKKECDYVIVLYHGGKEEYRYPSPELQRICRRIADKGADLIICQHTHCVGCEEKWNGSTIVYGQGNFLFDDCDNEFWKTSMLVVLENSDENIEIKYLPMCKNGSAVRLANSNEKEKILQDFMERSVNIQKDGFVESEYTRYAKEMLPSYYRRTIGKVQRNIVFKVLNKLSRGTLRSRWYSSSDALALINTLECEPHRELFLEGLRSCHQK